MIINKLRVLHVAVSMNPSLGVVKQMEWEQQAAKELGLPWQVILYSPANLDSPILRCWSGKTRITLLRYFLLRKSFYEWLLEAEENYDLIILRHSVHDIFEARLAGRLGHKLLTMHHTLEVPELTEFGAFGPVRAWLERYLGKVVLRRALACVGVTQEILDFERSRSATQRIRPGFVYPNGVFVRLEHLPDQRSDGTPELLFVASYFSAWHGLDLLIEAVKSSDRDVCIHLVGTMGAEDARRCGMDPRFVVHGSLGTNELRKLMARAWCGLSSFALSRNGMLEACSLKVREYLDAGLPIYAAHRDSGLPDEFEYFRRGPVDLDRIVQFAHEMRGVSREQVISAARPFISKRILLERFYGELLEKLAPKLSSFRESNWVCCENKKAGTAPGLVALTGASGFIGKAFLEDCLRAGWRVRVLTRKPDQWGNLPGLEVFVGDLIDTKDWQGFLQDVDVLVHAAAEIQNVEVMQDVNVDGPARLLSAAIAVGVRRWVQLSSVGAYGPVRSGWVDEKTTELPVGEYERTKTEFDRRLLQAQQHSGLQISILRPSNVYGPGMSNQSLFQLMRMIQRGVFAYLGPTGASANYVHVADVVQALMLCVTSPVAAGKVYIVSDWTTLENMIIALAKGLDAALPCRRFSLRLAHLLARLFQWIPRWPLTLGRVRALSNQARYSVTRIADELGWRTSVPVVQGMYDLALGFREGQDRKPGNRPSKILIISYDWPPRNSIATHRPYSWARYWSARGLDVTVVTAVKKFFDSPLDLTLPRLDGVRIYEADYSSLVPSGAGESNRWLIYLTFFLKQVKYAIARLSGWDYDVRSGWARAAKRIGDELGTDFDVVVSTYGPDSAHKIAAQFKKCNPSIFWVADYRDLWSQNARVNSSRLFRLLMKRKELNVVGKADLFTTVSDELASTLASLVSKQPRIVFNGFESEIDESVCKGKMRIVDGCLRIVYTGRIYPGKRSPLALVKAIDYLIRSDLISSGQICIDFYGSNTEVVEDDLKSDYSSIVRHHGHVPYARSIELQREAGLLLMLESGDDDSKGFLTGKLFEYIASGRPVISIGSRRDSAIARLLHRTGCGKCYEEDEHTIAADLLECLNGRMPNWFKPNLEEIRVFSRHHQAEYMLDEILSAVSMPPLVTAR